jgi:hypothetical protein
MGAFLPMRENEIDDSKYREFLDLVGIVEDALARADELALGMVAIHLQSAVELLRQGLDQRHTP